MSNGPFDIDVDTLGNMRPIFKVVFSFGFNQGDSPTILNIPNPEVKSASAQDTWT